ncbi:MAG: AAA family ATPase [Alphaproteobacteria bacterium]|nr:AAA family ATPase [Alphaproteobacteria bacterium]
MRRPSTEGGVPGALTGRNRASDAPAHLEMPRRVVGRDAERRVLAGLLAQVVRGGPRTVRIQGPSGIGKTVLARELAGPVAAAGGRLVLGKAPQLGAPLPLQAVGEALGEVCRELLTLPDDALEGWRDRIDRALGDQGRALTDVVPFLEALVGPRPPVPTRLGSDAEVRQVQLVRRFLSAVATAARPLVLVLDDLQWADPPTLRLLESIVQAPPSPHLLTVALYREGEGPEVDVALARATSSRPLDADLALGGLDVEAIRLLLGEMLVVPAGDLGSLAAHCRRRSDGNPLFVWRDVAARYASGDLRVQDAGWVWQEGAPAHVGLAELTASELRALPAGVRNTLAHAAHLGSAFDPELLAHVLEAPVDALAADLEVARARQLVVPEPEPQPGFRFVHDQVHRAAHRELPAERARELHRRAWAHLSVHRPEAVFARAEHLVGGWSPEEADLPDGAAALLREAGLRALHSGAYETAFHHLQMARRLVTPEDVELLLDCAEAAFQASRPDEAEAILREAGDVVEPRLRGRIASLEIRVHIAAERFDAALDAAVAGCVAVGYPVARKPSRLSVLWSFIVVWVSLWRRGYDATTLPARDDPALDSVATIAKKISGATVYTGERTLHAAIALTAVRGCLTHGNPSSGPGAYAMATRAFHAFGLRGPAQRTLQSTVRLAEATGQEVAGARCMAAIYSHWSTTRQQGATMAKEAFETVIDGGEVEYACYMANAWIQLALSIGEPLDAVVAQSESFAVAIRTNAPTSWRLHRILQQTARSLRGDTRDPRALVGDGFDERGAEALFREVGEEVNIGVLHLGHAILDLWHQDPATALDQIREAERYQSSWRGFFLECTAAFVGAVAAAGLATRERDLLPEARRRVRRWRAIAADAPDFQTREVLVEAGLAAAEGRTAEALSGFDRAARLAREERNPADEGLALELASSHQRDLGNTRLADVLLHEAREAYRAWGAGALVARLDAALPQTEPEEDPGQATDSVVRAARMASGRRSAREVLGEIVRAALETSHATRAVLVAGPPFREVAEATPEGVRILDSAVSEGLPLAVLHLAARTQEAVVERSPASSPVFGSDPWIAAHRPASLAALPLHDRPGSADEPSFLVLEHATSEGAFTHHRLELLKVLLAQAALTLRNARLADALRDARDTLDLQVAERTASLREAVAQLEEAARLREDVEAMLLHDLKTPLMTVLTVPPLLRAAGDRGMDPEMVDVLEEAGRRMTSMLNRSQDLFRMERGTYDLWPTYVALEDIVRDVVRRSAPGHPGVTVDLQVADGLPLVWGEELLCDGIVQNLVINALEAASPEGRMEIVVAPAEGGLALAVTNTGAVPESIRDRFFEKHVTADKARGSGLGTYIARLFTEIQGGTITARFEAGSTTVEVTMPGDLPR